MKLSGLNIFRQYAKKRLRKISYSYTRSRPNLKRSSEFAHRNRIFGWVVIKNPVHMIVNPGKKYMRLEKMSRLVWTGP